MQKPKSSVEMRPGRAGQQLMLRLSEALRDRIKAAADRNGRSLNAEIVSVLAERYPEPPDRFAALVDGVVDLLAHPEASDGTDTKSAGHRAPDPEDLEEVLKRLRLEVKRRRG